jgi:hypothetical protein
MMKVSKRVLMCDLSLSSIRRYQCNVTVDYHRGKDNVAVEKIQISQFPVLLGQRGHLVSRFIQTKHTL